MSTDRRSSRTRNSLADSLRELVCEQRFDKISIDQICENADTDISRRNFYHHFTDKYELLGWIYERDFSLDFTKHPDWTMFEYFPYFCTILYNNRDFYRKAFQIKGQNSLREYCHSWLYPLMKKTFGSYFSEDRHFLVYDDEEIEKKLYIILSEIIFNTIVTWLSTDPCPDPQTFSDQVIDVYRSFSEFIYGLVTALEEKKGSETTRIDLEDLY